MARPRLDEDRVEVKLRDAGGRFDCILLKRSDLLPLADAIEASKPSKDVLRLASAFRRFSYRLKQ